MGARVWIITLGICLILILSGCDIATDENEQTFLIVNFSPSCYRLIYSPQVRSYVGRMIEESTDYINVAVVAKDPLWIRVQSTNLDAKQLYLKIVNARQEQLGGAELTKLPKNLGGESLWGWGTDHAATLDLVSQHIDKKKTLSIVLITDGFNEVYPLDSVKGAIERLEKVSPNIHFKIMGLSQAIVDSVSKESIITLWRNMFLDLGFVDEDIHPDAKKGFTINSEIDES